MRKCGPYKCNCFYGNKLHRYSFAPHYWLVDWLVDWLIDRLIYWLIDRLIDWFDLHSIAWLSSRIARFFTWLRQRQPGSIKKTRARAQKKGMPLLRPGMVSIIEQLEPRIVWKEPKRYGAPCRASCYILRTYLFFQHRGRYKACFSYDSIVFGKWFSRPPAWITQPTIVVIVVSVVSVGGAVRLRSWFLSFFLFWVFGSWCECARRCCLINHRSIEINLLSY